jgi:hypothetical protein
MASHAVTFHVVEAFGPGHIGLWTLCPDCLRSWERTGRRLRVAAALPADGDDQQAGLTRSCSNCERPQVGYWSQLERWVAEWDEGVRLADTEGPPF